MAAGDISDAMLAEVRSRLREPTAEARTDDEIWAYLNEAQTELVTGRLCDAALLPFTEIWNGVWVTGQYDYSLPHDFLRERYVAVNGYPARRVQLLDLGALTDNVYWAASKSQPRYAMVDGGIRFYTGSVDPDVLVFSVHYIRKPMCVKAITSAVRSTNVVTLTMPAHGLTADNVGDTIVVEGVTPAGATSFNGTFTIASVPLGTTLTYAQTASDDTGTGGRLIETNLQQISTTEDPQIAAVFRGLLMDWAVSRCRSQVRNFGEAQRQAQHFLQRVEAANSRYSGVRPPDSVEGDPGRRVQPAAG